LIRKNTCCRYGVFKVRADVRRPPCRVSEPTIGPVSQSSTACGLARSQGSDRARITPRSTLFQASRDTGRPCRHGHRTGSTASGVRAPDSLERR
jgi:hypothetical protein